MTIYGGDDGSYARTNWWPFLNEAGETITASGIILLTGVSKTNGRNIITASKPDSAANFLLAVNAPYACPDGSDSMCRPMGECIWMAYDSSFGTPANEENWGADNASFQIKKNFGGGNLIVIGADTENEVALVMHVGVPTFLGVAGADIAAGASGSVSIIVTGTGNTGDTVTATNITDQQADTDNTVLLMYFDSRWNLLPRECPA